MEGGRGTTYPLLFVERAMDLEIKTTGATRLSLPRI